MLRSIKRNGGKPVVKLYPRLATVNAVQKLVTLDRRPAAGREHIVAVLSERDAETIQVRARLLQMILDNERTRHNAWRPNAS